jgi:hypothetical protein
VKRFVHPTREDLEAYAAEMGFAEFDAAEFLDHYEMVGWVVGRSKLPMVSWRAAVRTWRRNQDRWNATVRAAGDDHKATWKNAYDAICKAVWSAKPMGREAVKRAIQSARDKYRDFPTLSGRSVVDSAVGLAMNNPPPEKEET